MSDVTGARLLPALSITLSIAAGSNSVAGPAGEPELFRELNAGLGNSYPGDFTRANGALFFSANDGSGFGLWKTDGTAIGTARVSPVSLAPSTAIGSNIAALSGVLYFSANGDSAGLELWRSDGTVTGTRRVKDINPGKPDSAPKELLVVQGALYFSAYTENAGEELWRSDGTDSGTVLVSDINPGAGSAYPRNFTEFGGALYFSADDGESGQELWRIELLDSSADEVFAGQFESGSE